MLRREQMHHGQEVMNPRRNPRNPTSPTPVTCTIEKGIPCGMPFSIIQAKRRKQDLKASVPRMKRERNPKVKTPWDGVVKERADAPRSGGDEPKAKSAESDITDACYLHHRKKVSQIGIPFSILQAKCRKQDLKATNYNPSLHRKIGIYIHPIDMYNKTMI